MSLDPIATSNDITERYISYLKTTFFIRNDEIRTKFHEELTREKLSKGPILEVTPPFMQGCSTQTLVEQGILSTEFVKLESASIPSELYLHQEKAIRAIILEQRNIIAATGTGSGKTEIYLIPILNALMKEKEQGTLGPGVRALLLYPMNALVNDQLKRMRSVLERYPHITFGRYTGETEEEQKKAEEIYIFENGTKPLINEQISREKMRSNPPHILLTNYVMLEYLLLRPMDIDLFEGNYAGHWSFIVLDEIHTYTGAKGIEIAMLLRRLKERVISDKSQKIQCIGTSATLAGGRQDYPAVVQFAKDMFGEFFEETDIITAERVSHIPFEIEIALPSELYIQWSDYLKTNSSPRISYFVESLRSSKISSEIIQKWQQKAENSIEVFLYSVLHNDPIIRKLQEYLNANEAPFFEDVAQFLFPDNENAKKIASALISIAVQAKNHLSEYPLIPARYHFFIRAIEGAYIAFTPEPIVVIEPTKNIVIDNESFRAFEIGVCKRCGALYFIGVINNGFLDHPRLSEELTESNLYFLFPNECQNDLSDDNEDSETGAIISGVSYKICFKCGKIQKSSSINEFCNCDKKNTSNVINAEFLGLELHKCISCLQQTSKGSIIQRIVAGKDAIGSVLVTELYDHIPPKKFDTQISTDDQKTDPDWDLTSNSFNQNTSVNFIESRKLLVFSDSRQDAAFFAPYLNRTYHQIQRKALIYSTLLKHKESAKENQWSIQDLITPIINELSRYNLCESDRTHEEIRSIVWKWLLYEFFTFNQRINLEQLGLFWFSLKKPKNFQGIPYFMKNPWNLTNEETWILIKNLINSLRKYRVINFPQNVSPSDEFFAPQNSERFIRLYESRTNPKIFSWAPSKHHSNSRLDYLLRLAEKIKIPETEFNKEIGKEILKKIWESILRPGIPNSIFEGYFTGEIKPGHGILFQLNLLPWEVKSKDLSNNNQWFRCDTCNQITQDKIHNVCITYLCKGSLIPVNPTELFHKNHYYQLYTSLKPKKFKAEEHTAQLKKSYGREISSKFIHGKIDILCCSTTFELGVDVGELETVFLKNVPPSPANYIQRAGRAGRRTNSTAFCLTLCQVRSHDLHHFIEPERMVKGKILPPHFSMENEKIIRRHLTSMILSSFWKIHPETFKNVESFFFQSDGAKLLQEYLQEKPTQLYASLKKVIPQNLSYLLEEINNEWRITTELFNTDSGFVTRAELEIKSDIEQLNNISTQLHNKHLPSDYILRIKNTLLSRKIIDYLATHNVLPKYGFPVDVVELAIYSQEGKNLDLSRDLKIALSEYAPGSEIVANGKIWTSRYIKQLAHKGLEQKNYKICSKCKRYYGSLDENLPVVCEACNESLNNSRVLIVPEFGFIADSKGPKKPIDKRPERTYSTRVFYTGDYEEKKLIPLSLSNNIHISATSGIDGKFGVINSGKSGSGFKICTRCGYTILGTGVTPPNHDNPFRQKCSGGVFKRFDLGHEFRTDMIKLVFEHVNRAITGQEGFWHSLLYAILDGTSDRLDIERSDIDGCIYFEKGQRTAVILFDSVPGGAGHVKRLIEEESMLINVLHQSHDNLNRCKCGGEFGDSSCYSCLRNYYNQYYHSILKRGPVLDFLKLCLEKKEC